jgi:cysteine synthase A
MAKMKFSADTRSWHGKNDIKYGIPAHSFCGGVQATLTPMQSHSLVAGPERAGLSPLGLGADILEGIGNTPLVPLRRIEAANECRIFLKIESANPTGSMKDRMALAMIDAPERDGRLAAGQPVVEYTGGSTGVSLALVCAVKGHPLDIVTSNAFAPEKLDHMRLLGAKLRVIPSDDGRMTEKLTKDMIATAEQIANDSGSYLTDQMKNVDQMVAYDAMAGEIWTQTAGAIDAFVQSVGTAASIRGITEGLQRRGGRARIVAVEPAESAVLNGGPSGAHKIDGVGAGYIVPLWRDGIADRIEPVSTDDAVAMAFRLAREEGLFAGTSTGANIVAALREAERLPRRSTIVTVMCDTGMKYLHKFGALL